MGEYVIKNPQNILIFRLVLGLGHKPFAKKINKNPRSVRAWEHLEIKIKPRTAKEIIGNIKSLFHEIKPKINFENVLLNFRIMKGILGNRNLKAATRSGLEFAKNQKISGIEKEIMNVLEEMGIICSKNIDNLDRPKAEIHANVVGLKRKFNVDFAIHSGKIPKTIIETFSFGLKNKSVSNSKIRVCHIDHRFQMIKAKHPKVRTILFIKFTERPIHEENAKKSLEREILNIDHLIINDLEKLKSIIKNIYCSI